MMQNDPTILRIELESEEFDDGRILFSSPDLEGFFFVVNPDEDPITAMQPALMQFVELYLQAKVRKIEAAQTPRQYRQRRLDLLPRRIREYSFFAEVA